MLNKRNGNRVNILHWAAETRQHPDRSAKASQSGQDYILMILFIEMKTILDWCYVQLIKCLERGDCHRSQEY